MVLNIQVITTIFHLGSVILTIPAKWRLNIQWRHNGRDGVSNHQPHQCLLNRLFGRRSKKISKPRVTGLCVGNSPGIGEFPAQMASDAENVSIWWHHHAIACWMVLPMLAFLFSTRLACHWKFGQHTYNDGDRRKWGQWQWANTWPYFR